MDRLAFALATDHLLHACGKQVKANREELRRQNRKTFALVAPDIRSGDLDVVADAVFDAISAAVALNAAEYALSGETMPPVLRAALVSSAGDYGAAVARNSELLSSLTDLTSIADFEHQLCSQVRNLHGTMRLPHAGTTRQVPYERLFVQPAIAVVGEKSDEPLSLEELLQEAVRVVLLGSPGGGKSTSSLKLTYDIAEGRSSATSASVPFLVVLRTFAERIAHQRVSLVEYLAEVAAFPYGVTPPEGAIEYLLMSGRAFVIFDGLDELIDVSLRRDVAQAVDAFAHRYPLTSILVTSREVGYEEAPLDEHLFTAASLQDFDDDQVEAYVRKWFSLDGSSTPPRKDSLVDSFLADSRFVADLRVNPLMLSLMCGIYATENYIPRNRPDVYEKCALLLFERWDKQRGIEVPMAFDAHVQSALRALALWLYPQDEAVAGLPRSRLVSFMTEYLREKRFDNDEEAENAATQFIEFCRGRAWVLTDVGAERYAFTHRTFLEYFAASQLARLHPSAEILYVYLKERVFAAEWDMVCQLAIQILNRNVEDGADDFIERLVAEGNSRASDAKANALSFACRALGFVVPRPAVIRNVVDGAVEMFLQAPDDSVNLGTATRRTEPGPRVMSELLTPTAENLELVGRYLRDSINARLRDDPLQTRLMALAVYAAAYAGRPLVPGGRSAQLFWREFSQRELLPTVQPYMEPAAGEAIWIGRYLLSSGAWSMSRFLDQYGVRGLFAGDLPFILQSPVAVSVIYWYVHAHLREGDVQQAWISRDLHEKVIEALAEAPVPWVHSLNRATALWRLEQDRGTGQPLDRRVLSSMSLLALPYLERLSRRSQPSREERYRDFIRDFLPEGAGGRRASLERVLEPAAWKVVRAWMAEEISVTTEKYPRRTPGRRPRSPRA